MRIDYINGHDEFDGSLWFLDQRYVGHDDQFDVQEAVRYGHHGTVEFYHRKLKPGLADHEINSLLFCKTLADAEPFLEPSVEQVSD